MGQKGKFQRKSLELQPLKRRNLDDTILSSYSLIPLPPTYAVASLKHFLPFDPMFCQDALASRWHSFAPRSHCTVAAQLGAVPCKAESSATSGGGADIIRAEARRQGASQLMAVVHMTRSPPGAQLLRSLGHGAAEVWELNFEGWRR